MTNQVRTTPTLAEQALLAQNPTALFGFFIKTKLDATDPVVHTSSVHISQPSFKLFDGQGLHIIAKPKQMQHVLANLKAARNPATQWLLMNDALGQIPVYDPHRRGGNNLPLRSGKTLSVD